MATIRAGQAYTPGLSRRSPVSPSTARQFILNVNTSAAQAYANLLQQMGKSALPVAVRQTLNAAALDVKRVTMPEQSDKAFHKRKPSFFGATSSVDFATGLSMSSMRSEVGFVAPAGIKESGHATKDLQQQEHGGAIDKRAFIATSGGRTGRGNVKSGLTMKMIKPFIRDSKKEYGKNNGEQFIKAAVKEGVGGFIIGTDKNHSGRALLQIKSIRRLKGNEGRRKRSRYGDEEKGAYGGNMIVQTKEIYTVKGHRKAHVQATHFMAKASEDSAKKMPRIFAEYAQRAIGNLTNTHTTGIP